MRVALIAFAAASAAFSVPAFAGEPGEAARVAEDLRDPVTQARVAGTIEAVTGAVLDTPVGPLLRAMEDLKGADARYVDPDLRMGDLVDPETADMPYEIAHRLPSMMASMGALAVALEQMLPELRARIADSVPYYDY